MEQFRNPDLITGLGLGDKLLNSLMVMALGIGITFIVLIGLMAVISLLKGLSGQKEAPAVPAAPVEPVKAVDKPILQLPTDDEELLAVIAAAIQAQDDELVAVISAVIAMLDDQTSRLKIQSIRRISETMPAWAQSGLNRNMRRI